MDALYKEQNRSIDNFHSENSSDLGYLLGGIGLVLVGIAAQVYRYRRVSTPVQRQQVKWVVFGIMLGLLLKYATYVPVLFFPALGNMALLQWLNMFVFEHFFLCIPLSLGIALLRYRLWDIDILINRTLVYGTLTASLAFVYFGLIFALQSLLRGLINQNNAVAIVVSTLAIYVLFQPLRRRIQNTIDRRFYRRKYDAERILAAFSATLRHEVDLSRLSGELVAVVQETMQPAHISLWLRPTATNRKAQAALSSPPPAP